jgi:hypothetical protein
MSMKREGDPVVVLKEALKILDKGRHWGKGAFNYRDDRRITRFCPMGAVFKARRKLGLREAWTLECQALTYTIPHTTESNSIAAYNDAGRRTWAQVEKWIQRAIAYAASKNNLKDGKMYNSELIGSAKK